MAKPLDESYSHNSVPSRKLEKTKFTRRSFSNTSLRLAHLLRRTKRRRPRSFRPPAPSLIRVPDWWSRMAISRARKQLYNRRSIIFYSLRFPRIFGIFLLPHWKIARPFELGKNKSNSSRFRATFSSFKYSYTRRERMELMVGGWWMTRRVAKWKIKISRPSSYLWLISWLREPVARVARIVLIRTSR